MAVKAKDYVVHRHENLEPQTEETVMNVLMVITSHDQLGNTGRKTGFWLEALPAPYYTLRMSAF